MELYILRVGISKQNYPNIAHIFGLNHYQALSKGEDEFSKKLIYFYKYGNDISYFVIKIINLYKLRFAGDKIKFDYITLYPTRNKEGLNENMVNLIEKVSSLIELPYKQVIRRNKNIKPNHELKTFDERVNNIKDSIDVIENVTGKNIIIFDNTSTTGISMIDVTNVLLSKGAKNVVCICLGLSSKEKEKDWDDLNKTLKYSQIINICKSPFVKKELREEWRKKQLQN